MRRRHPLAWRINRFSRRRRPAKTGGVPPMLITIVVGVLLAGSLTYGLERKLRPTVASLAYTQVRNLVAVRLEQAITTGLELKNVQYSDLVTIQRDGTGIITALTTDTAALNQLRADLLDHLIRDLTEAEELEVRIPLGSLLESDLTWGRGPEISFRSRFTGTVSAEFQSDFSAAGVNQTLHRIELMLTVPVTVFLPGESKLVSIETNLPVAETVIVGHIPETFFHLPASG